MRYNIAISGVGGLGILTLGRLFSRAAVSAGKNAIMSEIHGLAQRYGAVVVHVRISDGEILAPMIPSGRADLLVSLEPVEALRAAHVVGNKTIVILNSNIIHPPTVAIGLEDYPDVRGLIEYLEKRCDRVFVCNALEVVRKYGDPRLQNTVLFGMASKLMNSFIPEECFLGAIEQEFGRKKKVFDLNLKAFREGQKLMSDDY